MENQEAQVGTENTENTENKVTEPTVEDIAKEHGWRPKEEYDGDPARWKSAEVFLALDEPIQKIEALSKKLKNTEKALEMLNEHHKKVKETEYKRALDTLKAQKKLAYTEGDVDRIIEIDERIAETKEKAKEQKAQDTNEPPADERFIGWVGKNKWYETDSEMRADADAIGTRLAATGMPLEEVLEKTTEKIKKLHPDKFSNPNRERANSVEGSTHSRASKGESYELSADEREIMRTFVRQGVMTEKEYVEELKKVKGAK